MILCSFSYQSPPVSKKQEEAAEMASERTNEEMSWLREWRLGKRINQQRGRIDKAKERQGVCPAILLLSFYWRLPF